MNLLVVGGNFRTMPIEMREKLAFDGPKLNAALSELATRFGCESAIVSTCNRVEVYIARAGSEIAPNADLIAEFVAEFHKLTYEQIRTSLYAVDDQEAVRHLFRVASSLDSLIVGEGQIAGQVKRAYESAHLVGTAGIVLHSLFQQANVAAKRVRTETGIARGHVGYHTRIDREDGWKRRTMAIVGRQSRAILPGDVLRRDDAAGHRGLEFRDGFFKNSELRCAPARAGLHR